LSGNQFTMHGATRASKRPGVIPGRTLGLKLMEILQVAGQWNVPTKPAGCG
jgi:hypothetical protein